MDVTTMAATLGCTRQTALRRCEVLEREGYLTMVRQGRRTVAEPVQPKVGNPKAVTYMRKLEAIMRKAVADLSELDS
jgi:DNA-binding transcriptional regulator YhcF (GntR family)